MTTARYNLKTKTTNPYDLHKFIDGYVRKHSFATSKTLEEMFVKHQIANVAGYKGEQMQADLTTVGKGCMTRIGKMINNLAYRGRDGLSEYVKVVDVKRTKTKDLSYRGSKIDSAAFCSRALAERKGIIVR